MDLLVCLLQQMISDKVTRSPFESESTVVCRLYTIYYMTGDCAIKQEVLKSKLNALPFVFRR